MLNAADPDAVLGDYLELVELLGVVSENVLEPANLGRDVLVSQTKEDDPCVRKPLPDDQLAEISIIGDQDALLPVSDAQDLGIFDGAGVVSDNRSDIMPEALKVGCERQVSAFIQQEPHRLGGGEATWCSGLGLAFLPLITRSAYSKLALTSSSVNLG